MWYSGNILQNRQSQGIKNRILDSGYLQWDSLSTRIQSSYLHSGLDLAWRRACTVKVLSSLFLVHLPITQHTVKHTAFSHLDICVASLLHWNPGTFHIALHIWGNHKNLSVTISRKPFLLSKMYSHL